MKKILFSAKSLKIGGIEASLVTLLNSLASQDYDITLVLEKKQGEFLNKIDSKIKIVKYSENRIPVIGNIINIFKRMSFKRKYENEFDFSASYCTESKSGGYAARTASSKSVLWVHVDYFSMFNNDKEKTSTFYRNLKYDLFEKVIFVSNEARDNFVKLFPYDEMMTIYCNNIIDGDEIIEKSNESIDEDLLYEVKETIFINVGKHDEKQKKISRIIEAAEMLKKDNLSFKILLIGNGKDTAMYEKMVVDKELDDKIVFLGEKKNPYPYYKISNCALLTSDYEGYPMAFLESMILEKPIITTNVSDYYGIQNIFALVTQKDAYDIYKTMKDFIKNGFAINDEFDYKAYNLRMLERIQRIINN